MNTDKRRSEGSAKRKGVRVEQAILSAQALKNGRQDCLPHVGDVNSYDFFKQIRVHLCSSAVLSLLFRLHSKSMKGGHPKCSFVPLSSIYSLSAMENDK
jgi:hypothetical protein